MPSETCYRSSCLGSSGRIWKSRMLFGGGQRSRPRSRLRTTALYSVVQLLCNQRDQIYLRLVWHMKARSRGRCYDHNFLRFLTIFVEKIWRFSQKPMLWSQFLQKLAVFWAKNANFFAENWRKYLKIRTSVPDELVTKSPKFSQTHLGPN
jgi:hypothetical protein